MKFEFTKIDKAGFTRIWNSDFNDGFADSHQKSFEDSAEEDWGPLLKKQIKFMREAILDDQLVGYIFLSPKQDGSAHLGYGLYKEFRGQGYSVEMCKQFLEIELPQLDKRIVQVLATTLDSNVASQRVLQKLGFKLSKKLKDSELNYLRFEKYLG